jgi:D-glycero-alpha-D-manno-heptose-7-phosphate kinase
MKKKLRCRAPLRLGFAGGGTDVAPYSDQFGGCILNATIDLFAYATIEHDPQSLSVEFEALDLQVKESHGLVSCFSMEGALKLHRAVYNRVVKDFLHGQPIAIRLVTWTDAPPGSGLGSSSTLVVSMLAAYVELLSIPLGEYDLAHLAYEIERIDCGLAGGKQDQYAATFGGFNFMEFYSDDRVIVNPLRIRRHIELELQASLLLYFTGRSRESAKIIEVQAKAVGRNDGADTEAIEAMHEVKRVAYVMKESVLKGDVHSFHRNLGASWNAKKRMAKAISNSGIEEIAARAFDAGAKAVKISGAGGGGFMMISIDPVDRHRIVHSLKDSGGLFHDFNFTHFGVETWFVN